MLDPLFLPFFQRGLIEILILAIPAGLIGSWVVLRGLAFFSHAIGTASFPGLVLADGIGFPSALGAFGAAGVFAGLTAFLNRSRRAANDSVTALVLVGCLAFGVILASDVFGSSARVDTLLFGSLLSISVGDIWLAVAAAGLAVLATSLLGHRWLARGFDDSAASRVGAGAAWLDGVLLLAVAVTVTASLNAVGALLVTVLIVIPAATVRLIARRLTGQLVGSVLLVAAQGGFGFWLSFQTDAPPGATIAVISGVTCFLVLAFRKSRRRIPAAVAIAALLACVGAVAGCGENGAGDDRVRVVATTTQVGDLVGEIGGDRIDLTTILQPNTDPHDYEPRPSDVKAVADADLIFRSGGHLDEWTDQIRSDSGSEAEVVDLSLNLPVELDGPHHDSHGEHGEEGHDHDEIDPHWWHDPVNVRKAAQTIAISLSEADRSEVTYFTDHFRSFSRRVEQLDRRIAGCIRSVPVEQRKIVTDHDSFSYFTDRYGIESVGTVIPALTTQAQPSAGDLAELEQTIEAENVTAIFSESSLSADLADAVSRDSGANGGYSLYADTLGPEGSAGESWLAMMKSNTDSLMLGMTSGQRDCFGTGGETR